FRHEDEITGHKIRSEVGVTSSAVTLRSCRKIQTSFLQEVVLLIKTSLTNLFILMRQNCAQNKWRHAGVQILADLERDLHFFLQGRRDVFCNQVLRLIVRGERLEVELVSGAMQLRGDPRFFEGLH